MVQPVQPFKWVGGALCLDFNNTVDWDHLTPSEGDRLADLTGLAAWGREAHLLSATDVRRLVTRQPRPADPRSTLQRAWEARQTIHQIFYPVALGQRPAGKAVADLNGYLAQVPAQVVADGTNGFRWSWPPGPDAGTMVLWPVLWSAGQLLTSPGLVHLKTCANEHCGWLFVDASRKHNRRWCEMGVCGNRAKVRRFYQRRRTAGRA